MTPKDWIAPGLIVAIMTVGMVLFAARFAAIDDQYANTLAKITEIDTKLDQITGSARNLHSQLDQSVNSKSAIANELAAMATRQNELDNKLSQSFAVLSSIAKQFIDVERKMTELEGKLGQPHAETVGLAAKVSDITDRLSEQLVSVHQQHAVFAGQLGEINAMVAALKQQIENARGSDAGTGQLPPESPARALPQ